MGVFKKLDNNGQVVYGIDYYCPNGKRYRYTVGSKKALAEAALAKIKVEIAEDKFLDKKKIVKVKFSDFADEYIKNHCAINHSNMNKCAVIQVNRLKEFFKNKCLDEITTLDVERFKRERMMDIRPLKGKRKKPSRKIKPGTVNRGLSILKNMFYKAIAWDKFDGKNPAVGVKMLDEGKGRLRYLEKEEINRLIDSCEGILKPIVIVAIYTGMRRSEIFNLKWRDLDFGRDTIHLYKTKNKEKREVYMNETVKNALIGIRKHKSSQYVFCYPNGKQVKDIRKPWIKALKEAGLNDTGLVFHGLRHTFCSQLAMAGVDLNTVRELAGHKSMAMTLRYSHLSPSHKKSAVDILSQRLDNNRTLEKKAEPEFADQLIASFSNESNCESNLSVNNS